MPVGLARDEMILRSLRRASRPVSDDRVVVAQVYRGFSNRAKRANTRSMK